MPRSKNMVLSQITESLLPAIKIKANPEKEAGCLDSCFGGIFYLPQGESIPSSADGEPLEFIAQINFHQLPPLETFPERGILQFFLDTDHERIYNCNADGSCVKENYCVRYYPNPDAALQQQIQEQHFELTEYVVTAIIDTRTNTRFELKEGIEIPPEFRIQESGRWQYWLRQEGSFTPGHLKMTRLKGKMSFSRTQESATLQIGEEDLMLDFGYEQYKHKLTPELVLKAGYNFEDCSGTDAFTFDFGNWGCKIGGHPAIRQEDLRTEHPELSAYSTLLFQYDSTTRKNLEENTFCFFIRPEDLKACKFDDILLYWHNCW